jgi:hypothetical protein
MIEQQYFDLKFLRQINLPNLETRQHDVTKDDLETISYDFIHCRCLLMHLTEPELALKRMVATPFLQIKTSQS